MEPWEMDWTWFVAFAKLTAADWKRYQSESGQDAWYMWIMGEEL